MLSKYFHFLVRFKHRSNWPSRYAITNYYDFVIGIYNWFIIFQRISFIKIAIFLSVKKKKHPSQWLGNPFKINLFSVYRNSVESAKALVCNQLSRSECKPTRECLFHSLIIGEFLLNHRCSPNCSKKGRETLNGSCLKVHTSDHEWPRMTTSDHEWPRVTASDLE